MTFPGGKNAPGVYQRLISLMPPHNVYIEPFLGSGAVMRFKRPARFNIGIDLDEDILRKTVATITGSSDEVPHEAQPRAVPTVSDDTSWPRLLCGVQPTPVLTVKSGDTSSSYQFYCTDALAFLQNYPFKRDECIYCDPPYLMEEGKRRYYKHTMDFRAHVNLLSLLRELPCYVLLSGYWSELYMQELPDWYVQSYQAVTRAGHLATEYIWINYEPQLALHDYRYLGKNYRERERLKRQQQRWIARLKRMPSLERQALFEAIKITQVEGEGKGLHKEIS